MEKELWVDIPGYEGQEQYQVSNLGNVMSLNYRNTGKHKLLKFHTTRKGYREVCIWENQKLKHYSVHHLVWEAFNGPIPEGMQINHIDEDKTNNRLENLSLVTPLENNLWGTRIERIGKKVIQYDLNGNLVKVFKTISEAERDLGIYGTSITACCRGKVNTAGGFKWRYA